MTLCDAGPLDVLLDSSQPEMHKQCLNALRLATLPLITTLACFAEAMYLFGRWQAVKEMPGEWECLRLESAGRSW